MKISREWLSDYVDTAGLSDEELGKRLTEIGHAIESVEKHGDDSVFEVEFTANRIDAMSHFGLARDLAPALGKEAVRPGREQTPAPGGEIEIRIEAPELCDRYSGQVIRGVKVAPSSAKIRRRLEAAGLRPINNIVDATNYVMLALGHPLHAFDLREVRGKKILVRAGGEGEKLRSLDGVERTLDSRTCVIADGQRAVAIGGIIGGENSEISDDTTDVLLECAHFHAPSIRRAARRMGIKTDASYRFERGIDPNDTIRSISMCADLILEEAGGSLGDLVDVVAEPVASRTIVLKEERLAGMSAGRIGLGWALQLLRALGMETRSVDGGLAVVIPTWRQDIAEEADLLEEALRFYGYDQIPSSLPRVTSGDIVRNPVADFEDLVRDRLVAAGLTETMSYGFIHPAQNSTFSEDAQLELTNPLTENISAMRLSLAPGLLSSVAFNRSYGNRDGGLFEIGRTYHRGAGGIVETPRAGVVLFGQSGGEWGETRRGWDFFDLKGIVEAIAAMLHVELTWRPATALGWARQGAAAIARAGERQVAVAASVARETLAQWELKGDVWFAEIELDALLEQKGDWKMAPVSRHPGVPMVIAMMHAPDLPFQTIVEKIRSLDVPHLAEVGLWDRFVPEGGDEVKTALGMWYQAFDRSLTQEEIADSHALIVKRLAELLPVRILS
ncbi:MAG: phenylalanine--tRNA ligase subunit beta [Thermoanaerobaculia bacterium]